MLVPNRFYNGSDYRYESQVQEQGDELKGDGNSLNYIFRMQEGRRFWREARANATFIGHYNTRPFLSTHLEQKKELDEQENERSKSN